LQVSGFFHVLVEDCKIEDLKYSWEESLQYDVSIYVYFCIQLSNSSSCEKLQHVRQNGVLGRITRQNIGAFIQADSHGLQCGTGGLRPDLIEFESIHQRDEERAAHDDDGFMLTSWFSSLHAGAQCPAGAEIFNL
jgi:hypothetical protein